MATFNVPTEKEIVRYPERYWNTIIAMTLELLIVLFVVSSILGLWILGAWKLIEIIAALVRAK